MTTADRRGFLGLSAVILAYVALRAALVPWVHDECASLYWYVERGEWLPGEAHTDANNHFLSSALGILGYTWWGLSLFGSRWASVLAFLIYAWSVYGLGGFVEDRRLRWALWAALLACPFLLDFFSLFRGYGMALAFWAVALNAGLRYVQHGRTGHLLALLGALVLANSAVLIMLPVHALIVAVVPLVIARRWKHLSGVDRQNQALGWLVLGPVPVMFGAWIALDLQRQGLLYHGSTEGFVPVTVTSLGHFVLGVDRPPVVYALAALMLLASAAALLRKPRWGPAAVVAGLLMAEVLMRVAMAHVLGVNFPKDRAALHLVPLAILLVAFVADRQAPKAVRPAVMVLLFYLPLRTLWTANVDHTVLWAEQSVPVRFLEQVAEKQRGTQRPLIIGAYHQLQLCIPYLARLHGLELNPPDLEGFPEGPHDVRIVDERFMEHGLEGWREADVAKGPGLHLLWPERSLRTSIYARRTFPEPDPTAEFVEVWRGDSLPGDQDILVQCRSRIGSDAEFLDLRLVATVGREGTDLYYHAIPLALVRPRWNGEEMHLVIRVPAVPEADRRVVYLWNPGRVPVRIGHGEVKAHRTKPLISH